MLYCISGLGANNEMFSKLDKDIHFRYLPWLEPYARESLRHYADRMAAGIDFTQPVEILGYSFGGIVAQEIARYHRVDKIILVSAPVNEKELFSFFSLQRSLRMHRWVPEVLVRNTLDLIAIPFFQPISDEDRPVLKRQIGDSSWNLQQWSVDKVLDWKQVHYEAAVTRIHGTKDKLFPLKPEQHPEIKWVKDAGHFMVYNRAPEVSAIIREALQEAQG